MLRWKIDFSEPAQQSFKKLDRITQKRIQKFLNERLISHSDPRGLGKALTEGLKSFWGYRVGDYRIVCDIQDRQLIVLVVEVAHRKGVYDLYQKKIHLEN
ncbi:MAG: type II toxin-antitoxin system RelE/ParE family toxin [Alphaproteobacteria bacterium]|jgi:mRNA interferase RelE/StbE|nr:type II toxin-antitoxin system RelE/ParE family toxin [Alphaproteobacteria bacterium]MBT5390397.1 type II toxin-antitoxin system RelE/ParE family toxin [Alphaproteobacteria bacterium]